MVPGVPTRDDLSTSPPPGTRKAEYVYTEIKRSLLNGDFAPGAELSVHALTRQLGVSKQPVMDAVRRLEENDFVTVVPQVGVYVTVPSVQDVEDFFRVWAASEGVVAAMAADRRLDSDVALLEQAVFALSAHLQASPSDPFDGYPEINRRVHHTIHVLAGSRTALRFAESAWDRSDFLIAISGLEVEAGRLHTADDEHRALFEAIRDRDARAAREITEHHVLTTGQSVADAMRTH